MRKAEGGAEALGEYPDLPVEQGEGDPDDEYGDRSPGHALEQAEVVERAPDEGVGGADQLGDLDLLPLREDLQADGVEGHRYQAERKQEREQPDGEAPDRRQGRQAPHPGGVGL